MILFHKGSKILLPRDDIMKPQKNKSVSMIFQRTKLSELRNKSNTKCIWQETDWRQEFLISYFSVFCLLFRGLMRKNILFDSGTNWWNGDMIWNTCVWLSQSCTLQKYEKKHLSQYPKCNIDVLGCEPDKHLMPNAITTTFFNDRFHVEGEAKKMFSNLKRPFSMYSQ